MERSIGYASVVPAALIGVAGLADYAGPTGWLGISEFLGWAVVCGAAGLGIGLLIGQLRHTGLRRYAAVPLAAASVGAFTYLPYWLGLDAPMAAKVAFTTILQILGSLVPVASVIAAIYLGRKQASR